MLNREVVPMLSIIEMQKLIKASLWMKERGIPRIDCEDHDVYIARMRKNIRDQWDAVEATLGTEEDSNVAALALGLRAA